MRKVNHAHVRNMKLRLARGTALRVIQNLESTVEEEPLGKKTVVDSPSPVTNTESERLEHDAGRRFPKKEANNT